MAEKGVIFGETAAKQIAKTVREVSRRTVNEQPHRGRWQQKDGGGRIRYGLVTESLGCGFYTIELGTLDGDPAASGSGSCDPCVNVSGAGTSACALTLEYPDPRVTGSGVFVTAYDPKSLLVPLKVGTDCIVAKISPVTGTTWGVLNGFQEHIVQYKERWDCCEPNEPKLLGKTPIIFVGKECEEILCEECPASGSG